MSNLFAQIVLYSWPLVVVALFQRLPLEKALIWSVLAGYLLLPVGVGFNPPALPTVDKTLLPALSAAVMCLMIHRRNDALARMGRSFASQQGTVRPDGFLPVRGQGLFRGLLVLVFIGPVLTVFQNGEAIVVGTRVLRGMKLYDAMSVCLSLLVALLPFFLARRFLATDRAHVWLLSCLVVGCLGYSVLVLYEARMSPQLNKMIYGFFPHDWRQHLRGGGYRPIVFMQHGLWLAAVILGGVLAAAGLCRLEGQGARGRKWCLAALWLFLVLLLCRTLGVFMLALLVLPVLLFFRPKGQLLVAGVLAGTVLFYPLARHSGLIPLEGILDIAASVSAERAQSFEFRLDNEDRLLAKLDEKPVLGWGIWGRSMVFAQSGRSLSTVDGYWIIVLGSFGWVGYLAQFGFLCLPVVLMAFKRRTLEVSAATSGLALVLCAWLIDLIPNATISPLTWLVAGAILGRYQTARVAGQAPDETVSQGVLPARPPRVVHQRRPRQVLPRG